MDQMDQTEYDLIAANIIAQTLVAIMADIRKRMAPGGRAVLSGIIRERQQEVDAALQQHGLVILNRDTDAEWVTITVGREFH
jgi:ribosomal protein L11 methyltransferase